MASSARKASAVAIVLAVKTGKPASIRACAATGSYAQITFPEEVALSGQRRRYSPIACIPRSVGSRSR